jgi:hypothetical protein
MWFGLPRHTLAALACQPAVFFSHVNSAPATSQLAVFFSHNKSASATSHQPAERGLELCLVPKKICKIF